MKDKILGFFTDVASEMRKVTWPKRNELRESTVIVIVTCLAFSAFVYVVDLVLSKILLLIY